MRYQRLIKQENLKSTRKFKEKYLEKERESENPIKGIFYLICGCVYLANEIRLGKQLSKLESEMYSQGILVHPQKR